MTLLLVLNIRPLGTLCALSCWCPLNLGGSLESSARHSIHRRGLRAAKAWRPAPLCSTFCVVDHLRLHLTQGGQELIHGVGVLARSCAVELTTDLGLVEVVLSAIGGAKRLELRGSPRKSPGSAHQVLEVGIWTTRRDSLLGDSCGSSRCELAEVCSIHDGLVQMMATKGGIGSWWSHLGGVSSVLWVLCVLDPASLSLSLPWLERLGGGILARLWYGGYQRFVLPSGTLKRNLVLCCSAAKPSLPTACCALIELACQILAQGREIYLGWTDRLLWYSAFCNSFMLASVVMHWTTLNATAHSLICAS